MAMDGSHSIDLWCHEGALIDRPWANIPMRESRLERLDEVNEDQNEHIKAWIGNLDFGSYRNDLASTPRALLVAMPKEPVQTITRLWLLGPFLEQNVQP